MTNRGVTLIELLVAMATAAVLATVGAMLFKAAIMTYNYTSRQNFMLYSTRSALSGRGGIDGIIAAAENAASVQTITGPSLIVVSSGGVAATYSLSGTSLYRTVSGSSLLLADNVSTMTFAYYNLDSSGLIMSSTAANMASLVTALVSVKGTSSQRTYQFYAGAQLRNHQ